MRIAALDIGSNSFHLIVAHVNPGGRMEILDRAKEMVRLGETLRTGIITPEIFKRGLDALRSLKRIADRQQPDAIVAVATSAVREAQNGGEFARAVRDELGIDIRVIRGQEEAHLIYLGARNALDLVGRRVALFDVGGGSTELILADARECYFTISLKLGVLRLRDEWQAADPPNAREVAALGDRVRSALEPVVARVRAMGFDFVALTSGTAFALANLATRLSGGPSGSPPKTLSFRALCDVEKKLLSLPVAERVRLGGLDPRRADTVLPGAILLRAILELSGVDEATLCEPALREGIIADYVAKNRPGIQLVEEFPDQRRRSVMELARRCHYPEAHSLHVCRLALSIFHQTRELHGLTNSDGLLLEYATLLHDIGFHISGNRHHRHAHYLIVTHDMRGFSHEEIHMIASIARYHRKTAPKKSHPELQDLSKEAQKKVCKLASILRIADSLDRTHANLVRAVRCTIDAKTVELRLETDDDPELELWTARRKGDLFEELFGRRLRFAVDPPAEAVSPKGLAKEGEHLVHPTLAPKSVGVRRLAKSRG
ncbi:MAG TPA: Ppx/GppA phosphatase family protein [Polyangiaceae bacterium]|nr:Ppx/GppA phosphatase family protein [Polyangiaceae bacterium]